MFGFKGGVHPPESKLTADLPIEIAPLPTKVILPLSQHTGSPSKAIVKLKDEVKRGQPIAESSGFISTALHAPVSGKVTAIDHFFSVSGTALECIVIESDGADTQFERAPRDLDALAPEEITRIVSGSGIVGLGGAAFPAHVKLSPPADKPIDTVILNGCECEPCLTCDHRVMLEESAKVVSGTKLLMKALKVTKGIIAVEDNKPDAIEKLKHSLSGSDGIAIMPVKTKYPQGAEKQLIKSVTNRAVPSGGLPMHAGCSVHNVQTAVAVHDAVLEGKPLYERVVTITGNVVTPKNLRVRIGTPISSLVELCGGLKEGTAKLVSGGPMMGAAIFSLDLPVTKGTSGIVALDANAAAHYESTACIRCGRCIEACPMGLSPTAIAGFVRKNAKESAGAITALSVLDCIECASCAYDCPARIELVQCMKLGKSAARSVQQ